jgi:hypothetical protein
MDEQEISFRSAVGARIFPAFTFASQFVPIIVVAIYLARGIGTGMLKSAVIGNKRPARASNSVEETFYSQSIVIEPWQGKPIHTFHTFRRGGTRP